MYKTRKLWTPVSTVIRRARPTTCRLTPYSPNSQIQSLPSQLETSSRVPPRYGSHFLANLKISSKTYCSQPAVKIDTTTKRCWNCDAFADGTAPFLYCDFCRSIQPVDFSIDYFQIFGLEKGYEIEVDGLEGKYKDWQKKLHPDLVHSKSEKEREYAAEQSARVIDAYRTLSKPLSRAIYALRLEGVDVDEEQTVSDPELLTEIMEIREAVEEAPDSHTLNQIQSEMKEKLEESSNSFANAYQSRNFDEAVTCIQRMTYYQRASEEITKKL
ncbi:iron-sulfur cluster co-chaperone protein HscB, mitochondrial [Durio zibethinus]|uniref:Iron-sulfur cluster co-chaperone protein HscB, mitochondrial n=1 Tax=Durio zibethinus TaxID=66656 RepID=A0A6P6APV6_DURZI|nr:iron-sulfur cluster co-chaperone protein HscB, mitochondrial [Durio zibethinus]